MRRRLLLLLTALVSGALVTALIAALGSGERSRPVASPAIFEAAPVTSAAILPLRVPDPRGGPPWGLRLLGISRGLRCLQVGRVRHGRFGELGVDGAFRSDGRVHTAPPRVFAGGGAGAGGTNDECVQQRETFSGQIGELDRSAAFDAGERAVPRADLRQVSFGLLGAHARGVTYRGARGRVITVALHPPYGAYLIVQMLGRPGFGTGVGTAPGSEDPRRPYTAGLTGALTSILYRFGKRSCRQVKDGPSCSRAIPRAG